MQLDNLKEYFNQYVLNYQPYKDNPIYKQIINFLLNYYLKHSYEEIPKIFKQIYEQQIIDPSLYNNYLLSIGFPSNIVFLLNPLDKKVLIQSFMDFNRYKGSIELLHKLNSSFDETFDIYELFIDYIDNSWVFKPYPISLSSNENIITENYKFSTIYDQGINFFISEELLDQFRVNDKLQLPVKSNLLLVRYSKFERYSELNKIIFSSAFNHYKKYKLEVYLDYISDNNFIFYRTSFENIIKLWHYILFKTSNLKENTRFIYNTPLFSNIKISDLETVIQEYNSINTRKELSSFRAKYLIPRLSKVVKKDIPSMINSYFSSIPPDLITFVDNKLDADPENSKTLLQNILNSINTWKASLENPNYKKYIDCIINQLWEPVIDFSFTTPYILLNFLKPFHTELISDTSYKLSTYGDKFNSIWNDTKVVFHYQTVYMASLFFNDYFQLNSIIYQYDNSTPLIEFENLLSLYHNEHINSNNKATFNAQLSLVHAVPTADGISSMEIFNMDSDNLPIQHFSGFADVLSLYHNEHINSNNKAIFNNQLSLGHSLLPFDTSSLEIFNMDSDNLSIQHLFEVVIN